MAKPGAKPKQKQDIVNRTERGSISVVELIWMATENNSRSKNTIATEQRLNDNTESQKDRPEGALVILNISAICILATKYKKL